MHISGTAVKCRKCLFIQLRKSEQLD